MLAGEAPSWLQQHRANDELIPCASLIYVATTMQNWLGFPCTYLCMCVYIGPQAFGNYLQLAPCYATYIHTSYLIRCQETSLVREVLWVRDTNVTPVLSH